MHWGLDPLSPPRLCRSSPQHQGFGGAPHLGEEAWVCFLVAVAQVKQPVVACKDLVAFWISGDEKSAGPEGGSV